MRPCPAIRFAVLTALSLALAAGEARAQISENVIFHASLDEHTAYNDIWGYTAPSGDEYALLGTVSGLAVVNVVDPDHPYETGFIPGPTSTWRDIKTYQNYAYVTNETGSGLDIIDLSDPENPVGLPNYTGFSTAHNLFIDEATARCYIAGSNVSSGGVRVLSLANPEAPVEIGSWETTYLHDVVVLDNRLYGSAIFVARLYVLDVTNPGSITTLASKGGYPNAFTHNAWMTADNNYVMTTDETNGGACRMWDVSNLPTITQTDFYLPNPTTIPHNTHIDGSLAVISHYTLGVRVVDVSDPFNIQELGFYDTFPANDGGTFDGCWGAFPFFTTNPDLIVGSDISNGLFVLEYKGPLGSLSGEITRAGDPTTKISGAMVQVLETGILATTDAAGTYTLQDVAGSVNVQVSAFGYQTKTVPATIVVGSMTILDVALDPLPGGSITGTVTDAGTALPIQGATVEILATPLLEISNALGNYSHATVPVGSYTVRTSAFAYNSLEATVTMSDGSNMDLDFALNPAPAADSFEAPNPGWLVSGNASTGQWERGDPQPTNGGQTQTGDDHTPAPGVNAWITGLQAGTSVGSHDVDNGSTVLTSPLFDVTGLAKPRLSYWRWYVTGFTTNPSTDFWVVEISSDAGASWALVENTDQATPAWVNIDVAIDSLITPSTLVRFRFTAQDTGSGSITEAGVDDLMIYDAETMTGVDAPVVESGPGTVLSLGPAFPNPFRAGEATAFPLVLPAAGRVAATVYDVAGRRVATLMDGVLSPGSHVLAWDGRGSDGRPAPAGVYFLRLEAEAGERSRKMLLIR